MRRNDDRRVLRVISDFWNTHAYAPALEDIAGALGCKRTSAHNRVRKLRGMGLVATDRGKHSTLRLTTDGIRRLEGNLPLVPLDGDAVAMLRRGGYDDVAHLTPDHVAASGPAHGGGRGMSDYCRPAPDREKRRQENAAAMSFVHGLLTMVVLGAFMFMTGIAAAAEDMSQRPDEVYSERCGVDRCEVAP